MKKKALIYILLLSMIAVLVGCSKGGNNTNDDSQKYQQNKELTICSLYKSQLMQKMINRYTRINPDVMINYNVLWDNPGLPVRNDLVKTLNTELLAGKGADILILDHLHINNYIEKGVLMDLSDIFMDNGLKDDLLKHITDSYIKNDQIYCMPIRFRFPYYGLREDITEHLTSLDDIAVYCQEKDTKLINPTTYDHLINSFLAYYSNDVINDDDTINREGLTSFLKNMNMIAQQTESFPGTINDAYIAASKNPLKEYPDSLMWENGTVVMRNYINSISDLEKLTAVLRKMGGTYTSIYNCYEPSNVVGINNATKHTELAKDFVSFLFDEKNQSANVVREGLPVSKKALEQWKNKRHYAGNQSYTSEEGANIQLEFDSLTENEIDQFIQKVDMLDHSVYSDDCLTIFYEEGAGYLEGSKTLDEAVDDIMNRYNLFMKE